MIIIQHNVRMYIHAYHKNFDGTNFLYPKSKNSELQEFILQNMVLRHTVVWEKFTVGYT